MQAWRHQEGSQLVSRKFRKFLVLKISVATFESILDHVYGVSFT